MYFSCYWYSNHCLKIYICRNLLFISETKSNLRYFLSRVMTFSISLSRDIYIYDINSRRAYIQKNRDPLPRF